MKYYKNMDCEDHHYLSYFIVILIDCYYDVSTHVIYVCMYICMYEIQD